VVRGRGGDAADRLVERNIAAAAFDKCPVLRGLEIVVMRTEPVEQLEDRRVGSRPVLAVIVSKNAWLLQPSAAQVG
jgi:hypothetical protein